MRSGIPDKHMARSAMNREERIWACVAAASTLLAADTVRRGDEALWPILLAAVTTLELEAILQGDFDRTITRTTRRLLRTHRPLGRTAFLAGWGALAVWYARHITQGPRG